VCVNSLSGERSAAFTISDGALSPKQCREAEGEQRPRAAPVWRGRRVCPVTRILEMA